MGIRIKPMFAWYDFWVGVFIDRQRRRVYIFPIPMFGIMIERSRFYARFCHKCIQTSPIVRSPEAALKWFEEHECEAAA